MPKVTINGQEYEVLDGPQKPRAVQIGGQQYEVLDEPLDEPSFEGGVTRAAAQGLTFGFGDELEAGVRYLAGQNYEKELRRARRKLERFSEKHPYIATGAELLGGAVVPVGAGANIARRGLSLANVGRGAVQVGAPTGALFGLGKAEGIDSPEEAIGPAASGALAGAAGYAVGAPIAAGLARGGRATYDAVRDAFDPRGAAARKGAEAFEAAGIDLADIRDMMVPQMTRNMRARGMTDNQITGILTRAESGETLQSIAADVGLSPRVVGRFVNEWREQTSKPLNLIDRAQEVAEVGGRAGAARPITDLGRAAVAVAREGEAATERLVQRQIDQPGRALEDLNRAGGGANFESEFQRLNDVIERQASARYRQAYAGNPQVNIAGDLSSLRRTASRRAGDIRRGMDRALGLFRDNRGRAFATLRKYHDARQALDQMIEESRGQLGRDTPLTRELNGIRRRLNDTVRQQNRALAEADDLFSGARGGQQLLDLGRSLVARSGAQATRQLRRMATMTDEQSQMVRLGFLQRMADDIENKRLGNETVSQFRTPAGARMIRAIVGGDEAERLISDFRSEAISTKTLRDMYSGSRTAPLMEDMKALEENAQLAAAALTGNVRGVAQSLATRLRRQIGARQSRELLNMLTADERAELLRVLDELEAGGQALQLRQGGGQLLGLAGGATAAGQGGQLANAR